MSDLGSAGRSERVDRPKMERLNGGGKDLEIQQKTPKGCVPLGIYRVEETKGLIDGMGTVGLHGANGHNGSIEGNVVYSMPSNSPWEAKWSRSRRVKRLNGN